MNDEDGELRMDDGEENFGGSLPLIRRAPGRSGGVESRHAGHCLTDDIGQIVNRLGQQAAAAEPVSGSSAPPALPLFAILHPLSSDPHDYAEGAAS